MKEKWKRINGFPYYKVSNFGNVKSLLRLRKGTNNAIRKYPGRILKPGKNTYGYPYVVLVRKNKFKKTINIHILVLKHFGPPKPSPKHQCNHKDGNKENNHISNLEWVTPSENIRHAFKNGLISIKSGENHHGSKLTTKKVKLIRSLYRTGKYTQNELGKLFDLTQTHIGRITRNERWINYENSKKPFGGRFENQPEEDDIPF